MSLIKLISLTTLAMIAFTANSLLCRVALSSTEIDAASFTSIRILSGALTLALIVFAQQQRLNLLGNWWSALALFGYAAGFSFAYLSLTAATGALLLFGSVQISMISYGLLQGERINPRQWVGFLLAIAGLLALLLPGLAAPPFAAATLMIGAGISWAVYSLRGRGASDATAETAGNFVRAVPFALLVSVWFWSDARLDITGVQLAIASGALASGVGYALWYAVLPQLPASSAATVQLTVPALAVLGGMLFLGESLNLRLVLSLIALIGGVLIFLTSKRTSIAPK